MKNLTMIKVENEQQALDLLMTGNYIRHISSTQMNMASSRSHAIFTIVIVLLGVYSKPVWNYIVDVANNATVFDIK